MQSIIHKINKFLSIKIFGSYKLNLLKIFNRPVLGFYEGNLIYREIHDLLINDKFVIFDFNEIIFDKSFIEYAVCKHLKDINKTNLLNNLAFINISETNLQYIDSIIMQSDKYWNNREFREWFQHLQIENDDQLVPISKSL